LGNIGPPAGARPSAGVWRGPAPRALSPFFADLHPRCLCTDAGLA